MTSAARAPRRANLRQALEAFKAVYGEARVVLRAGGDVMILRADDADPAEVDAGDAEAAELEDRISEAMGGRDG